MTQIAVGPSEAIALENSPDGVRAARAAGLSTVLVRSDFFRAACLDGAMASCNDLDSRVTWTGGESLRVDVGSLRCILDDTMRCMAG